MNNSRRKQIEKLIRRLENDDVNFEEIGNEIEGIMDDEQFAFDNLPDSFQDSVKGDVMQEAIEYLQAAYDACYDEETDPDTVIDFLDSARCC
ncbi:MAG: hypothetical protein Q4B75_10395 [Eubacteriales bacterium]|nr:hypothetical protein [Eubacteriales bacterium]